MKMMKKGEKLMKAHFQIFNDIYINCKYHAILNMLNVFNVDVSVILYNYITIYKSSPQYNTYKPEYITTRNIHDILFENGILEEKIDYTLNLFEKIKDCNKNNCCAIIRVDMYEIPYHKGYFKKKHYRRYVLLYDIDIEKGIVKILDREKNNVNSNLISIHFRELSKWYDSYLKNFYFSKIDTDCTLYIFKQINKNNSQVISNKNSLLFDITCYKTELYNNIKTLQEMYTKVKPDSYETLKISLSKILLAKQADKYRFNKIGKSQCAEIISQQINMITVMFYYIEKNDIDKVKEQLKNFIELEEKFNLYFIKTCGRVG